MTRTEPDLSSFPVHDAGTIRPLRDHGLGLSLKEQRVLAMLAQPDCFGRTALASGMVSVIGKRGGISLVVGQVELTLIDALVQSGRISREGQGEVLVYRVVRQQAHTAQPVRAAASPASRPLAKCAKAVRVAQETPLQWLARRKDKAGQPMLSPTAQAAGERLQQDFMQAGMSPKMSADWSGLPASGFGHQGGGLLPGERQMAARQRLRLALDACGGELAGVLLDLCCFLKPLETVEHERGWPARSGKVILKLALSALMRHYGVSENAQGPARSHKTHIWHAPARQPD